MYGSLTQVRELLSQVDLDASSKPTNAQATQILIDISNEIDVRLSAQGFLVPVTTPAYFVGWLGTLAAYGSAAAILKSRYPDTIGPDNPSIDTFWETRYQEGLAAIVNGDVNPPDALSNSNLILASTYLTRNPDAEESLGDIAEPLFKIGTQF